MTLKEFTKDVRMVCLQLPQGNNIYLDANAVTMLKGGTAGTTRIYSCHSSEYTSVAGDVDSNAEKLGLVKSPNGAQVTASAGEPEKF